MVSLYGDLIAHLKQYRLDYGGVDTPGHYTYKLLTIGEVESGLSIQLTAEQAVKFAQLNDLTILK